MESNISFSRETFPITSFQDGLILSVMTVIPEHPHAILQIAHGMCEHKERYLPFMEYMASQGFACIIHDHRGHGKSMKSQDDLGYFYANGGPSLVKDLHQISRYIRSIYPDLPLYLLGHSMGSLAARVYLKHYEKELDKLILCGSPSGHPLAGPGLSLVSLLSHIKGDHARSPLINQLFSSAFEKPFAKEGRIHAWICSDPKVVEEYNASALCNFTFTLNGYQALLWLLQNTYSKKGWHPQKPDLPIFFFSGQQDPCMVSEEKFHASVHFLSEIGYRRVSSRLYPGMRHEILNEPGRMNVFQDIREALG